MRLPAPCPAPAMPLRRLRLACAAVVLGLLAACGFQLRGTSPMPFETLYVGASDSTRFGADLRRALRAISPNTRLVDDPQQAEAQFQQISLRRGRTEVSLNAQGRVEEYELSIRYRFRLVDSVGQVLIPDTELVATRDMQYDTQVVQAKEGEMQTLYEEMQRSLVDRIVRRLTAPDVREAAALAAAARRGGGQELPVAPRETRRAPDTPEDWAEPDMGMPIGPGSGAGGLGL